MKSISRKKIIFSIKSISRKKKSFFLWNQFHEKKKIIFSVKSISRKKYQFSSSSLSLVVVFTTRKCTTCWRIWILHSGSDPNVQTVWPTKNWYEWICHWTRRVRSILPQRFFPWFEKTLASKWDLLKKWIKQTWSWEIPFLKSGLLLLKKKLNCWFPRHEVILICNHQQVNNNDMIRS